MKTNSHKGLYRPIQLKDGTWVEGEIPPVAPSQRVGEVNTEIESDAAKIGQALIDLIILIKKLW